MPHTTKSIHYTWNTNYTCSGGPRAAMADLLARLTHLYIGYVWEGHDRRHGNENILYSYILLQCCGSTIS